MNTFAKTFVHILSGLILTLFILASNASVIAEEIHLFVLSGQSNMAGHRPEEGFTPTVQKTFGKDKVLVIQDAQGGQPIRRWYKEWLAPSASDGELESTKQGDLYDRLMNKVKPQIEGKTLASVTLVWMQGERDARMKWGDVYAKSLVGLYQQLSDDLGRDDVNFVIGRLSDFDMENARYPHWTKIREIQVEVAESHANFGWIDTDDLNDGLNRQGKSITNDLHYSAEGYTLLGVRFAEMAIELIDAKKR